MIRKFLKAGALSALLLLSACGVKTEYTNALPKDASMVVAVEVDDVARDSNGAELFDGDAVTVIKDLKVKGSSMVIKRGTKVRSIRLTENPEEVDCKIDGSSIVLKTCFLKK